MGIYSSKQGRCEPGRAETEELKKKRSMKSRITKQKRKSEVTGWVQPRISGSNCRTSQKAVGKAKETAGVKQRLLSVEGRKEMGAHRGAHGRISGKPFTQAIALQTARLCGGLPGSAPGRSEAWRPANLVPAMPFLPSPTNTRHQQNTQEP